MTTFSNRMTEIMGSVQSLGVRLSESLTPIMSGLRELGSNSDLLRFLKELPDWLSLGRPANLQNCERLEEAARLAFDEGIPLSWVPRPGIVEELLDAHGREQRQEVLTNRFHDILQDCSEVLAQTHGEWAHQAQSAVDALAAGFAAPAQSHAANVIDSVVLRAYCPPEVQRKKLLPRDYAKILASRDYTGLSSDEILTDYFTCLPLDRAFVSWFPDDGDPPLERFSRHVTAHAVGTARVFDTTKALIAVMLATSLVRQFRYAAALFCTSSDEESVDSDL